MSAAQGAEQSMAHHPDMPNVRPMLRPTLRPTLRRRLLTLGTACLLVSCARTPAPVTELSSAAGSASNDVLFRTTYGFEAEITLAEMTRHPRGFLYRVIEQGTGMGAAPGRRVAVSYVVRLADGREVDRAEPARPMRFRIGEGTVISAFDAAVREMRVGAVHQLVVPPRLGYGARGRGPVPPNAVLVMIVKLEHVQ